MSDASPKPTHGPLTGMRVLELGHFVAAPAAFAFNTRLRIPGYDGDRAVPVLDRGGAISGDHLDVFFPTHEQAKKWGRQYLAVTVVTAAPGR